VEEVGVDRSHGRSIRLFQPSDWTWEDPRLAPFVLFVGANANADDEGDIHTFATDAVNAGCAYVCTWGEGCSWVHDLFDLASIAADRFVMSSWHASEPLSEALYFALFDAWPDDEAFPDATTAPIILAVEEPWLTQVRQLVANQEELVRLVLGEEQ
jgi:hypothetical protein